MTSLRERFEAKYEAEPTSGCWLWNGALQSMGYGVITVSTKRPRLAHRVSYELHIGPIPEGLFICHSCDTPSCVNPAHLFPGTHADNMLDMASKNRGRWATEIPKTHCPQGHPYAGANLYVHKGWRYCRTCNRARCRARARRKSGELR